MCIKIELVLSFSMERWNGHLTRSNFYDSDTKVAEDEVLAEGGGSDCRL